MGQVAHDWRSRVQRWTSRCALRWFIASLVAMSFGVGCGSDSERNAADHIGRDGGAGGSGGSTDVGDARASDSTSSTVVRLTFTPEAITAEPDPNLDEMGYFRVQVFDTPTPPIGDMASRIALYDEVLPSDFQTGGEMALSSLPMLDVPVPDVLSTVYVRALFLDNPLPANGTEGALNWGTWFGGVDVSNGFTQTGMLTPVFLTRGETTSHDVPLLALRRVTVSVTSSVTPVGDGEGALSVAASRVEVLPPRAATYGYGIDPCVDLNAGPQTVEMQVVGSGTFFVVGFFDDLGIETTGQMPPGTMLSVRDVNLVTGTGTFDRITLASDQYSAALAIDLGYVVPLPVDGAAPGPNSCRDLGLIGDAGP